MLKYKNQLLPVLLSLLLCAACSDIESQQVKDTYNKPVLSEVTCENLNFHYEKCERHALITHIKTCRDRYVPKLFQCYGAKAAGF